MLYRKLIILLPVLLGFIAPAGLFPFDQLYIMGKEDNWKDILYFENTLAEEGKWGLQDIVLSSSEYETSAATDLLIHFNQVPLKEETGNYQISGMAPILSGKNGSLGRISCAFQGKQDQKELVPGQNALFAPGTLWNDFSMEFWIYPATLTNGETLLSWNGSLLKENAIKQQSLNCYIQEGKITWDFRNFFLAASGKNTQFLLTGFTNLLPRKWYHHLIRFNSNTGMLEYLINGTIEAIVYTTDTLREGATVHLPFIGNMTSGNLVLGRDFTGFIDELRITREFLAKPLIKKYDNPTGRIVSRIVDFEYTGTLLKQIKAVYAKPGNTEIYFFYKVDDRLYTWDSLRPEWVPFIPGKPLNGNVKGQFLQIMIELYTDGTQSLSPAVSSLELVYEPDLPPLPPSQLVVIPGNGRVDLKWKKVNEYDIAGYLICYGEYPGAYTGETAREGISPVDAGNTDHFTLTNLKNGKLYFFALVAYDTALPPHRSSFSKEVSARPSVLYK